MAKVLIAGCGDVGGRLARELVDAGHEVHGLRRSPLALPGVRALAGDVTRPETLRLPPGLDYVVVLLSPGGPGADAYRRVYFDGTHHLLAALAGQRLRRLFWGSSTSVYGQEDGSWVDEGSLAAPASPTAAVLREAETLALAAPWPATIVRLAGLYGPGRLRLLRWVQEGRPVQAEPLLWTNRLHVEDAAGLLAFLLQRDAAGSALENCYIGTDARPAPQHEVLDWLASRMGLPPVPHENRPGAGSNKRLGNARLAALGYRWRFPDYVAGYEDVIKRQ